MKRKYYEWRISFFLFPFFNIFKKISKNNITLDPTLELQLYFTRHLSKITIYNTKQMYFWEKIPRISFFSFFLPALSQLQNCKAETLSRDARTAIITLGLIRVKWRLKLNSEWNLLIHGMAIKEKKLHVIARRCV